MNIQTIAEHSLDLDLLPEKANILDAGCRGFLFARELVRLGHNVYTIDPDPKVVGRCIVDKHFQFAIAGENGLCSVKYSSDPQATTIVKAKIPLAGFDVPMYTIENFSYMVNVPFWDLIKLDIEGSEYEVIMSMDRAYAKQLSIEFHLHTGVYTETEILLMENKLLHLGYFPTKHNMTKQHGLSWNYWDSLFILQ